MYQPVRATAGERGPAAGQVYTSAEKREGSSEELLLLIVRDGKLIMSGSTTDGHGVVWLGPFRI